DQSRDIHEFNRGRHHFFRMAQLREHVEPRIRYRDHADIRIDGAERIVRRLRLARAGDGVEQSGFTYVGKTDDAGGKHGWDLGFGIKDVAPFYGSSDPLSAIDDDRRQRRRFEISETPAPNP